VCGSSFFVAALDVYQMMLGWPTLKNGKLHSPICVQQLIVTVLGKLP
jgi:hypothetical protein